jgi:hypothetical protein
MDTPQILNLGTVDNERDCVAYAVCLDGYNGELIVTVLCTGYPMFTLFPNENWRYDISMIPAETDHLQALAAFLHELDGDEDLYKAYIETIGTPAEQAAFSEWNETFDGHPFCAYVDTVAEAVHAAFPDRTPEPPNSYLTLSRLLAE